MSKAGVRDHAITVEWGVLIEVAAQEVFRMMLDGSLDSVEELRAPHPDITAMVGLAGQICGVFSIGCSNQAAVKMTTAMLGLEPGESNQETWDAVGEVCNMVAGNFKSKLKGVADGCMLSVPTVVTGVDYAVRCLARGERTERVFRFHGEPVWIALEVEG